MSDNIVQWVDSLIKNKVSFIIPTINGREHDLNHNVRTIIDDFEYLKSRDMIKEIDYEIVIVYDGCDRTLEQEILEKNTNIKEIFLKEKSGCVSIPRNIGISHATGDIICPTDDDVHLLCKKWLMIKRFVEIREQNEKIKLIYGKREEFVRHKNGEYWYIDNCRLIDFSRFLVNKKDVGLDNGQFIYSADIYKKIDPFFAINACDWELYSRIGEHYDFDYFDHTVVNYIWHDGGAINISRTEKSKRVDPLKILNKYICYFCENGYTKKIKDIYSEAIKND